MLGAVASLADAPYPRIGEALMKLYDLVRTVAPWRTG